MATGDREVTTYASGGISCVVTSRDGAGSGAPRDNSRLPLPAASAGGWLALFDAGTDPGEVAKVPGAGRCHSLSVRSHQEAATKFHGDRVILCAHARSTEPAHNPAGYHCGSVWPQDNAIIAAGLVRYGLWEGMVLDRRPREPLTNLRYNRLNASVPGGLDD